MALMDQVPFQFLMNINANDENHLNPLVLPRIFKSKVPEDIDSINVIDFQGNEYPSSLLDAGNGQLQLSLGHWHGFVAENILVHKDVSHLLFRLFSNKDVEVLCFRDGCLQTSIDKNGEYFLQRYLCDVTEDTIEEKYFPHILLQELNEMWLHKPNCTAELHGKNYSSRDVSVIYDHYFDSKNKERVHAVGFERTEWTNFCKKNNVEDGYRMIVKSLGNGVFEVDALNGKEVGLGYEIFFQEFECETSYEKFKKDCEIKHTCRLDLHIHTDSKPSFKIVLQKSNVKRKSVTIPKSFVRKYDLNRFKGGLLVFRNWKHQVKFSVLKDKRRPNDLNHIVMKRNWSSFAAETGLGVGSSIRFELEMSGCKVGGLPYAYFRLC